MSLRPQNCVPANLPEGGRLVWTRSVENQPALAPGYRKMAHTLLTKKGSQTLSQCYEQEDPENGGTRTFLRGEFQCALERRLSPEEEGCTLADAVKDLRVAAPRGMEPRNEGR